MEKTVDDGAPQHVQPNDLENVLKNDRDNNDGQELIMEELIPSYRTMYQKFLQIIKVSEKLTK